MKSTLQPFKIVDAQSLAANYVGAAYDAAAYFGLSLQYLISAGATGSLKVQKSNVDKPGTAIASTDWVDIPTVTLTAVNPVALSGSAAQGFWEYSQMYSAKWIRVVYTFTSGTGTLTVWGSGVRLP